MADEPSRSGESYFSGLLTKEKIDYDPECIIERSLKVGILVAHDASIAMAFWAGTLLRKDTPSMHGMSWQQPCLIRLGYVAVCHDQDVID